MLVARRSVWLVLLLSYFLPGTLPAGHKVKFSHLTLEDGLPEMGVWTLLQDRLGFMWFGTSNGLTRYDGYSFETFKPDPDDPASIGGRLVTALTEDREGNLWVGTRRGGINRLDRSSGRFERFQHDPADPQSLTFNAVGVIYEDSTGTLWVGTGDMESKDRTGGLNRFDRTTGRFDRFQNDPDDSSSLSDDVVLDVQEDAEGRLWIATTQGLNLMDPDTESFERFFPIEGSEGSLSSAWVSDLALDHDGNLWVGTIGGLDRWEPATRTFKHYRHSNVDRMSLADNGVSTLFVDEGGALWVGTWAGVLHRFFPENDSFVRFEHNPDDPYSLNSTSSIMEIFQDRSKILWVGTFSGGISKLDPYAGKFPHYGHEPDNPNSLSDDRVLAFFEDRAGNLWIGTKNGGLNRYNPKSDTYTHFRHDPNDAASIGSDSVAAILEDTAGTLWIGTRGAGVDRFNPDGETFTHFRHDPDNTDSLSSDYVVALHEDRSGNFWVFTGEGGGIHRFDRSSGSFEIAGRQDGDEIELAHTGAVLEDGNGILWLGTFGGLVRFDPANESVTTYLEPISGLDIVMSLHEDRAGRLWVGTLNGGIHLFDRNTGTSTHLTQREGLAHDRVYSILEDDTGRLWLSTANGVSRFDPETLTFRNYGVEDGLQSHKFGGGAIRKRNGELLFGGDNGINAFYPEQVEDSPHPPQVVLTRLKIGNDVVSPGDGSPLERDITVANRITLEHDQDVLTLEFAGLHYGQPAQNRYSYRLEPFDKDWIRAGTDRHASYTNLNPGQYTFRVRAANSDGVWNERGASIDLTVLPPWWQTWWAYALFVLAAFIGFLFVHRFQRNQVIRRERERAKELENELRAEAAEAQAKAAEAEAKALRIENERTARELEEARLLQISMLPVQIPDPPNLEIATFMKTATEVGGDYYDFDLADDGTLTVAIGDATGHGTRAGTMVTATKVLFNLLASEQDGVRVLRESTKIIRQLNMQNLFMSLALAKIRGNQLEIAGAGMPPTLIRRAESDEVEEIELFGAPLGSFVDFHYQTASVDLHPGDTVVMMSDGLPEMIGDQDEVFGYDRVGSVLRETDDLRPQSVIDRYSEVAAGWANGRPQDDDVTLIVMRMKAA